MRIRQLNAIGSAAEQAFVETLQFGSVGLYAACCVPSKRPQARIEGFFASPAKRTQPHAARGRGQNFIPAHWKSTERSRLMADARGIGRGASCRQRAFTYEGHRANKVLPYAGRGCTPVQRETYIMYISLRNGQVERYLCLEN